MRNEPDEVTEESESPPAKGGDVWDLFAQEDASIHEARMAQFERMAPTFDRPITGREYNVTMKMIARIMDDLSEGQVQFEYPPGKGKLDRLPAEAVAAITGLHAFQAPGLAFDLEAVLTTADGFSELAGVLSSYRSSGNGKRAVAAEPERVASITTGPELAAVDRRDEAGGIAASLREPSRSSRR